jgi:FkbM family methyltransferase
MEANMVQIDKVRTFFLQFSILNAIRFLVVELIRYILDPCNISSYSQTGEDRILSALLPETGFYVDVGCNHPQSYSNTFFLYKKRWIGITIDANNKLIQKHQRLRRRDLSICAVVSDKEQQVIFTDFEDSLVSSLNPEHISEWQKSRAIKQQRIVNAKSLSTILSRHEIPKNFDLLSIDVEGHDFEVLCSLDLNIYRPKLIVIEIHGFNLLNPGSNKIYEYLRLNNYKMIGYIVVNVYFSDTFITTSESLK